MRRRAWSGWFCTTGLALPHGSSAQLSPPRLPRIGVLGDQSAGEPRLEGFRQGLRDAGWVDGRNVIIEYRYAEGRVDRFPALVAELLKMEVDVLVLGADLAVRAAMAQAPRMPIVFAHASDPVGLGVVRTLARPGGNVTGQAVLVVELVPKQLELLRTIVSPARRLGLLVGPGPTAELAVTRAQAAAQTLGLELLVQRTAARSGWTAAFEAMKAARVGAVLAVSNPTFGNDLPELARLSRMYRLPGMYNRKEFAQAGGLLAYGPSFTESYRRAAGQVDKLLRGARAAELPVEQPTVFELVVNMRSAKLLGLTLPNDVLLRADETIE